MAGKQGTDRAYETFDPTVDWSCAADIATVKISLPGFKREQMRVLVDNHGNLRATGERPVEGNKSIRFQKDFKLPVNCNVDGIRAKFESETLTVTLPTGPHVTTAPTTPAEAPAPAPAPARAPAPPQKPAADSKPAPPVAPQRPAAPEAPKPKVPAPAATPPAPTPQKDSTASAAVASPFLLAARSGTEPAVPKAKEEEMKEAKKKEEEMIEAKKEEKEMESEVRGKMEEDKKSRLMEKEKMEEEREEAMEGMREMETRRRPALGSRKLLANVAVALVVLVGITMYVWHTIRNASGGASEGVGIASYKDEM